jgi:type III secretion protein U
MAGKDDAEEATLEPSAQRLRQLRDKGQVPRSQEMTGAITLLAVLFYVIATHQMMIDSFAIAFRDAPFFEPVPFEERAIQTGRMMLRLTAQLILPVMAIAIFSAIAATILDVGGFMFSMQSLAPNFAKFNPVTGLSNIFTMKSLIDLVKSAVKIVVFFACLNLIVRRFINDAFWAPTCGMQCILDVGATMVLYIIIVSTFLLILFASIDFVITRWLFTRDNKMTLTEMKREMKESFGDPHVRGERDQIRKEMAEKAGLVGPNAANLWIAGPDGMIGITYKPEESGVPIVAAKGVGENFPLFRERAMEKGVAIAEDPALFAALIKSAKIGQPIPRETFTDVAQALVRAGFSG